MPIHRVAPVNMGNADGTTWQDAIDLQTLFSNPPGVIPFLQPGDEIWFLGDNNIFPGVSGHYNFTSPLHITVPNVSLYGGFDGSITNNRPSNIICNNTAFPNYFQYPSILQSAGMGQSIIYENDNDSVIARHKVPKQSSKKTTMLDCFATLAMTFYK